MPAVKALGPSTGLRRPSSHFCPLHVWIYKLDNVHWGLFVALWFLMTGNREKRRCFLALIIYEYLEGLKTLDCLKKPSIWATEQEVGWLSSEQFGMKRNESCERKWASQRIFKKRGDLGVSFWLSRLEELLSHLTLHCLMPAHGKVLNCFPMPSACLLLDVGN